MKKLLTVLLVNAVMFTFSFVSAMATTYTLDDYATALTAEKTAQLGYINSVKTQYVNSLTYDDDGFATVNGTKYMKAALEAAANEVIADADKAMKTAIDNRLNNFEDTTTAPDKTVVSNVASAYNTVAVFGPLVEAKTETLNKTQAPLTKKFVQEKVTVDLSKYNSTDKTELVDGVKITKAQYVQKLMDDANDAIAAADKESTDVAKMNGYWTAYNNFKTLFDAVKTLDDEKYEAEIGAGTVEAAVEAYAKAALEAVEAQLNGAFTGGKSLANMAADDTVDFSALVKENGTLKAFWEANKTNAKKGELFGAAVANIEKVTRTEVVAIVNGYKAAVAASKPAVKAFADGDAAKLNLTAPNPTALELLARASDAVEKYADVTKLAGKYKAAYVEGVKQYDDASVDTALKAAEQLVYDDMKTGRFEDAAHYLKAAAEKENVTLEAQNYEYEKFMKAVEDAAKKFYKDGTKATEVQVKVPYGDDKTAEADLVYLKGTYASGVQGQDKWEKIATKTIKDLKDAQSYDEIKTIMAKAAEDLGKLLKADDKADVEKARTDYKGALANYKALKLSLVDTNVYPEATLEAARLQGEELIDKAVTVDAVKAAYEEAKALIDNVKTKDELKAAKEALEKQISELPYTAKLTVADKAAVKAAYDAYHAFTKMAGADVQGITSSVTLLQQKYDKVNELVAEEIDAKAKAINKKLDDLTGSDADIAAKVALKAEAEAVLAEAKALTDEIEAVNEDHDKFLKDVTMNEVEKLDEVDFSLAVATDASRKLTKAGKEGATFEEMKEALDAYNALTDKQKYQLDAKALPLIKVLEQKLGMTVKSLKITAKSTAKKGSITVKWTVKGEADIDGFEVWKSTKHSKGYKKAFTTTKKTYKNSKGLKKGSRYYYKVRAYKVIDGVKVTSDWSNKARRVAK